MSDTVNYEFGLLSTPLPLTNLRQQRGARIIQMLNRTITVPAFSVSAGTWGGVSQVAAATGVSFGSSWSIRVPVTRPNNSFVAAVRWTTSGTTYRRKLWGGIGEVLNQPLYTGEVLPSTGVRLEFWTVEGQATLSTGGASWSIALTLLELPTDQRDTTATDTLLSAVCVTQPTDNTTLATIFAQCTV